MNKMILFLCAFLTVGSSALAKVETLAHVDLAKFAGTWYRISANPIIFEPACACARQVLSPGTDGKINVLNTCNKDSVDGKLVSISGTATPKDASNSKLSVNFGLPWGGDFYIIALAPDYQWAVVTDRFGYSLYIQAKTPTITAAEYTEALKAAAAQVNVSRLQLAQQNGCTYPADVDFAGAVQ